MLIPPWPASKALFATVRHRHKPTAWSQAAIPKPVKHPWEHGANRAKLIQWYWNGVFGELYGSAVETRIACDFMEVPPWLKGGAAPSTVSETMFRADRLKTMRMRLSAAYKGVNALLMKEGAQDFRSGQEFDHTVFFGENVDIHHIFPQDWCKTNGIEPKEYDSSSTKRPAPSGPTGLSVALRRASTFPDWKPRQDAAYRACKARFLPCILIDPALLRADDFKGFMIARQKCLQSLIEQATGKAAYAGTVAEEGEDVEADAGTVEAEKTIAAA